MLKCRSPLGLRGLKSGIRKQQNQRGKSQPTRAAWIEIDIFSHSYMRNDRRSPLGLRGLKFLKDKQKFLPIFGRSPLGLRGLKYSAYAGALSMISLSQPTRAAWIEINADNAC